MEGTRVSLRLGSIEPPQRAGAVTARKQYAADKKKPPQAAGLWGSLRRSNPGAYWNLKFAPTRNCRPYCWKSICCASTR